jgi:hypothetical protein
MIRKLRGVMRQLFYLCLLLISCCASPAQDASPAQEKFDPEGKRKTTEAVIADLTRGPSRVNAQAIVVPAYEGHPVDVVDARELSPEKLELSLSQDGQPLRKIVVAIDMAKK